MALSAALEMAPTHARRRIDRDRGALVGSRCESCNATSWPARAICHRCGQPAMREAIFATSGSLLTYTTVWVGQSGLQPPYTIGQIKLEDGPLVFGHVRGLDGDTKVPVDVRLVIAPEPNEVPPFWFERSERA